MRVSCIKTIFLLAAPVLLLASCKKNSSTDDGSNGQTKGNSKVIVDTYLDTTGPRLTQNPINLCLDNLGTTLFVAQHEGIYKLDPTSHQPSLLVGSDGVTFPESLWFHENKIYTGDLGTGKAIVIDMSGGVTEIKFNNPDDLFFDALGVVIDKYGNYIIADPQGLFEITAAGNNLVQIGVHATNTVTDGDYMTASFGAISAITEDDNGNIFIADAHRIRKVDVSSITTISGSADIGYTDGAAKTAQYGGALTICPSGDGGLYVADYNSNVVRKMAADGSVTTIAGNGKQGYVDGPGDIAEFYQPSGIAFSGENKGMIYVSDYTNHTIRRITLP